MLFVPRQVRLASAAAAPAAAAMAKEEAKKEKKSKSKASAAAAKASPAPDARVLAAVAAFLESSGLPRTLAALQSEANLAGDSWRSSPVNLADAVLKSFDSSSSSAPVFGVAASNGQEKVANATAEEKDAGKKKKSKKGGGEVVELEADDETREKKRKKKTGDDAGAEANTVAKTDGGQKPDGKKKKSKKQDKDEDVEARLEKVELAVKAKFEAAGKLKDDGVKSKVAEPKSQNGEPNAGDAAPLDKGKKSKKKKKKSGSEENVLVKPDDENNTGIDIEKGEDGRASTDDAVISKKRKLEDTEGSKLPAKEDITATEDDAKQSKPNKRQKLSSEPKTMIAFQRVKLDDVKFADERLQDNSYWAKGGADSGYGAKAQEILGQVRGRGFRHEKTKKKRGTYRGGLIDLQTHSIKFNNSDDE